VASVCGSTFIKVTVCGAPCEKAGPADEGDSYIIVASKGGAPDHPGWYKNLLANPEVEVQVGTKKLKAKARTITGTERERLWEKAVKFWPPYADYAKKTERQIPVVLLYPVG
jgi:deazaflavin-dependent oxidoreductase (nitroreductase family)